MPVSSRCTFNSPLPSPRHPHPRSPLNLWRARARVLCADYTICIVDFRHRILFRPGRGGTTPFLPGPVRHWNRALRRHKRSGKAGVA